MADSEILINLFNNNSNNHLNNNVIRLLKIIYNNLDTTDKNKLNDNLKIYGLKQSELDKFYKYLDNYNKQNEVNDYLSVYKDYDVLLVGPQMRYKIKDVQKAVTDRPSAVINPSDYALGNVENIIKEVKRMIKEGK